jgi:hypothetical protein
LLDNENIFKEMRDQNLFDYSFWEDDIISVERKQFNKVRLRSLTLFIKILHFLDKVIEIDPNISVIKTYKKSIKAIHSLIPDYLEEIESKRKQKEVVPDDFLSDEEVKQEQSSQFKPPKPMKPGKRRLSGGQKSIESQGTKRPKLDESDDCLDANMPSQSNSSNELKDNPD